MWFQSTGLKRQIELLNEQIGQREEQLSELEGVETGESAVQREELEQELKELLISREGMEVELEQQQIASGGRDFFDD